MKFFVVPSLSHVLVLGIDFWRLYQLKVDIAGNSAARGSDEGFCDHHVDKIMNFKIDELVVSDDPLSLQQREKIQALVEKYRSTLGREGTGCTNLIKHKIDTGNAPPVRSRAYRFSPTLKKVLVDGKKKC